MQRRILQKVSESNDYLYLVTPEDIILQQLIWYRDENQIFVYSPQKVTFF